MKSLFVKTLLWFLATMTVAIVGILVTTAYTFNTSESRRSPVIVGLNEQVEDARRAFETGGATGLAAFLKRLSSQVDAEVVLTDSEGKDLVSGKVRPELKRRMDWRRRLRGDAGGPGGGGAVPPSDAAEGFRREAPDGGGHRGTGVGPGGLPPQSSLGPLFGPILGPFLGMNRPLIFGRPDSTRQYWLFVVETRNPWYWFLEPRNLLILGLVVLLCYGFAYHLTSPVQRLQKTVYRFGGGDFAARAITDRGDEIGQLAKTFNEMADRIQTLLKAERRLLQDISHELRSPLARLCVAIELARSGDNREATLDRIQKEADRLNELVSELLQVTRAEGDPNQQRRERVQLDELLTEIRFDSEIEAKAKSCELTLHIEQPLAVVGDDELLRRAVENIVRNAIRHAPANTTIEIGLRKTADAAEIKVRDYGAGVPPESLKRIFDAFYRVDSDRNRRSGGVGLGLAIASRAIQLHKGKLHAENAAPGLLVVIELPLLAADGQFSREESAHLVSNPE